MAPRLVAPRVVTLDASLIANLAILHGLKSHDAQWDAMIEDPSPPLPDAPDNPAPLASPSPSAVTVPASLRAELEELLGVALPPPGAPPALPPPGSQPTAAALQTLLSGEVVLTGRAAARVMRELEAAEVAAQGPHASFGAVLARLQKLRPRHYSGPLGALRRARLWLRVNGPAVAAGVVCVLLVGGIATLCVFCPVAGIVVAACELHRRQRAPLICKHAPTLKRRKTPNQTDAVLVLGAGGAQAAASERR